MESQIDESLYSRQLYVIGKDAMEKMMKSKILVIGLDGLGQEVVKNLCLTGVSYIYIYDKSEVMEEDLSTGFYFSRSNIGMKKDEVLLEKFRSLNDYVSVNIYDDLSTFTGINLVISCNEHIQAMMKFNRQTRRDMCKYIGCQSRGVFSQIFCDFGVDFICVDTNGEAPVLGMINDISSTGVLTVIDEQRHNLEDGDIIKIICTKNNDKPENSAYDGLLFKITSLNKSQVQLSKIDGSSILETENSDVKEMPFNFTEIYGGDFEQVKKPKLYKFKMLEDLLEDPNVVSYNYDSNKQNLTSHKCFIVLSELYEKFHQFPTSEQFLASYIKKYNSQDSFVKLFGRQCDTLFMPMCSIVGGIVAQEALKGISCKFSPLLQFLYYDAIEIAADCKSEKKNSGRYKSMYKIFGEERMEKLFNMNIFLVGAGAIGCEHLKNIVMCGLASHGKLNITDMDSIEQSNLNRQFLFCKEDVEKMKAGVAASKICTLNEDFLTANNTSHYNLKVGIETEEVFSDVFFKDLDVVANALDNVEARVYIDERCVLHRKPLVDSGTSGTKGNVQTVVPMYSESYGSSRDPPEKSIPLCTIKNFPHAIEHTIEWAMSEFRLRFFDQILKIKEKREDEDDQEVIELLKHLPQSNEDCIRLGLRLFIKYFHTSICDLLKTFPHDSLTKEGQPFWMPPKRAPVSINFDLEKDLHLTFVRSVANIYKTIFNIHSVNLTNTDVKVYITNELENIDSVLPERETNLITDYESLALQEFEKDNDKNNHVDFIFACANLRAQNYKIKIVDRLTVKGIAGRIIPAIATTTAVVSGLAIIEMIKLHLKYKNSSYKNSFLNLALPFFATSDLIEAEKHFYVQDNKKYYFNMWNRLEYKDTLLKNIIKAFEIQFSTHISMLTIDNRLLFWDIDNKYDNNLNKKVSELVEYVKGRRLVIVDVATDDDRDEFPRMIVVLNE